MDELRVVEGSESCALVGGDVRPGVVCRVPVGHPGGEGFVSRVMTRRLGLGLAPEHGPQVPARDVAQHRRVDWLSAERKPIAQLGEVEAARPDGLRRDVAVLEGNVLLEPGEDELVDPGDVIEDLGCFADSVPGIRGHMVVDE